MVRTSSDKHIFDEDVLLETGSIHDNGHAEPQTELHYAQLEMDDDSINAFVSAARCTCWKTMTPNSSLAPFGRRLPS